MWRKQFCSNKFACSIQYNKRHAHLIYFFSNNKVTDIVCRIKKIVYEEYFSMKAVSASFRAFSRHSTALFGNPSREINSEFSQSIADSAKSMGSPDCLIRCRVKFRRFQRVSRAHVGGFFFNISVEGKYILCR